MGKHYVWYPPGPDGDWVEYDRYAPRPKPKGPLILRDIEPYRCVVDGEVIGSRRRHKEKLRETGCVEWGNEVPKRKALELPPVAPDLKRAVEMVKGGHKPKPLESAITPKDAQ